MFFVAMSDIVASSCAPVSTSPRPFRFSIADSRRRPSFEVEVRASRASAAIEVICWLATCFSFRLSDISRISGLSPVERISARCR